MVTTHQVVHLEDVGIAPVVAAAAVGMMVAMSSGGRILGGVVGQWIQLRYLAAVASVLQASGIALLLFTQSQAMVYPYVVCFGLGYGSLVILFPSLVGAYFGMKNYARIFGMLYATVSLMAAASPTFAGFMFDRMGSYVVPFSTAMGLCVVGAVAGFLARPPKPRPASLQPSVTDG